MNAFQDYFIDTITERYADFKGRASRSEYWFFTLFSTLFFIGIAIVAVTIFGYEDESAIIPLLSIFGIAFLAYLIPALAVTVRRFHDIGKSGVWYLIAFIPFGSFVIFIFTLLESQPGENKWGPNPLELEEAYDTAYHDNEDEDGYDYDEVV